MELTGKVVVVPLAWEGGERLAASMAAAGATVVLVGPDAEAAGRLAGVIEAAGAGRPGIFVTDDSDEGLKALAGYLAELFRSEGESRR